MLLLKGTDTIESTHAECVILKSGISGVQYLEVKETGHRCPFTRAEIIAPDILDFLSKHDQLGTTGNGQ